MVSVTSCKENNMWVTHVDYVKLSPTAHEPTQGSEYAAGYDLYADLESQSHITLAPGEYRKISTGIALALPTGTFGAVYPRSGMATKRGLVLANGTGIIDSDYRGPLIVALKNTSDELQVVEHGERIAQIVVTPYCPVIFDEAESIGTTARGEGGFGSTGTK
jgi:dUTP pyrophosphatase